MAFWWRQDHAGPVGRVSRAGIQPRQAVSLFGLERTLAQLQARLDRTEKKVVSLEKRLKKTEAERDYYKEKYKKAASRIREQDKQIKDLTVRLDKAEEENAWLKKKLFGDSTEVDALKKDEPKKKPSTGKRNRGQQPGAKGHGRTKRTGITTEDVPVDLENPCCPTCAKPFKRLPETDDSLIVELENFLYQLRYQRGRYVRQCKCEGPKVITAPPPLRLYPRTNIGNSLWVHLCVQKFLYGMPTNRILKNLALKGLSLSIGTVTGGMAIINGLLEPITEQIRLFCQAERYWHADETFWRVFSDNFRKKNKKWWLWVVAGKQAVVYILDKSRSRRVPEEFFAHSIGTLMTDRYSAYKSLPASIRKAWCWVHVRRDILKLLSLDKFKTWAKEWLLLIAKLFVLNEERFRLWSQDKDFGSDWTNACQRLTDHVTSMQSKWEKQLQKPLHKKQRTILQSLQRHWQGLTLFLHDPRVPLHNNKAERLLRGCVLNRKASYGSGAEWSGHLAAKFFTIFQTWLINGLDPEALLLDYFNQCSQNPGKPPPSINNFLPWKMSDERKAEFSLPISYKRPA